MLLAGELQLLGDHPRFDGLILGAQDVGQHGGLQLASRGRRLFNRRFLLTSSVIVSAIIAGSDIAGSAIAGIVILVLEIGVVQLLLDVQLVPILVLSIHTHVHNLSDLICEAAGKVPE
jgi:hypothetical protein